MNLNASKPPFNDKRLRQAIAWAIDRAEIVKLVYFGSHVVTAEPTPEPSPWATGVNAHKGGPDLAKAKQLMAEAGVTGGLTLTYLVKSQVPVLVKTGEILREQLKKIGITLEVQPLESGQYFEAMVGKKFDIVGRLVERHRRSRHVLLAAAALELAVELRRLQVRGGRQADRGLPLHHQPGRAQEDVSGDGALVPGGRLDHRLQQRDPALLDEAQRAGRGAVSVARAQVRGDLARLIWPRPADVVALVYAARRLLLAVPLLFGMSVLVFGLMRLVPGDPAVAVLGYKATPEGIRALREAFHLDEPLLTQYLRWLAGALRGDFGVDFRQNEPIGRMILDRLPVTIELTLLATLGAALIGIPLGLLGGARRGGLADRASLAVGLLGISIPDFWLGIMLILGLALGVGLFPSGGWVPISEGLLENLWHLVLPALTLAVGRAAVLGRLTRAAVLDVVQRSFVQFARAKGLAERAVLFRHVLPNAAIPIVTVLGLQIGYMLGGAIVVEMIFTLPGVGRMTLDAVLERNYPVVQSTVLVIGAMFMLVNLATDILYGVIDPRVRRR